MDKFYSRKSMAISSEPLVLIAIILEEWSDAHKSQVFSLWDIVSADRSRNFRTGVSAFKIQWRTSFIYYVHFTTTESGDCVVIKPRSNGTME